MDGKGWCTSATQGFIMIPGSLRSGSTRGYGKNGPIDPKGQRNDEKFDSTAMVIIVGRQGSGKAVPDEQGAASRGRRRILIKILNNSRHCWICMVATGSRLENCAVGGEGWDQAEQTKSIYVSIFISRVFELRHQIDVNRDCGASTRTNPCGPASRRFDKRDVLEEVRFREALVPSFRIKAAWSLLCRM